MKPSVANPRDMARDRVRGDAVRDRRVSNSREFERFAHRAGGLLCAGDVPVAFEDQAQRIGEILPCLVKCLAFRNGPWDFLDECRVSALPVRG
jgi:hypothetical protein